MRLNFLGADHEVTGSCHFLQACGVNILVDCGMEQGNDVYENQELPIPASEVDYVKTVLIFRNLRLNGVTVKQNVPTVR